MRVTHLTRRVWRSFHPLEDVPATLALTIPAAAAPSPNPLYPNRTGSPTVVTFTGATGAWGVTAIGSDGFRQVDTRKGKAVLFWDRHAIPNGQGGTMDLTYAGLRAMVGTAEVKGSFNGEAMVVRALHDDPLAGSVVVEFEKTPAAGR